MISWHDDTIDFRVCGLFTITTATIIILSNSSFQHNFSIEILADFCFIRNFLKLKIRPGSSPVSGLLSAKPQAQATTQETLSVPGTV